MKKIIFLLIPLLFFGCKSIGKKKEFKRMFSDSEIIEHVNIETKIKTAIIEGSKKDFLEVKNKKTGKRFLISHHDWKVMARAYKNWRAIENQKPTITKVIETKDQVIMVFNYYRNIKKDGEVAKKSVFSGKVIINKKFIRTSSDEKTNIYLKGALVGTGVYGILITVMLLIALL